MVTSTVCGCPPCVLPCCRLRFVEDLSSRRAGLEAKLKVALAELEAARAELERGGRADRERRAELEAELTRVAAKAEQVGTCKQKRCK